jgi:hypothetical protein
LATVIPDAAKKEKADTLKTTTEAAIIDMIHASANLRGGGFPGRWDRMPVFFSGASAVAAFHRICLLFSNISCNGRVIFVITRKGCDNSITYPARCR